MSSVIKMLEGTANESSIMRQSYKDKKDWWRWLHSSSGCYSINIAYQRSVQENEDVGAEQPERLLFKRLWSCYAPRRLLAISWKILRERVPARDNMKNRGVIHTNGETTCSLCVENQKKPCPICSSSVVLLIGFGVTFISGSMF